LGKNTADAAAAAGVAHFVYGSVAGAERSTAAEARPRAACSPVRRTPLRAAHSCRAPGAGACPPGTPRGQPSDSPTPGSVRALLPGCVRAAPDPAVRPTRRTRLRRRTSVVPLPPSAAPDASCRLPRHRSASADGCSTATALCPPAHDAAPTKLVSSAGNRPRAAAGLDSAMPQPSTTAVDRYGRRRATTPLGGGVPGHPEVRAGGSRRPDSPVHAWAGPGSAHRRDGLPRA
jgi:hypothetical protein